MLLLEAVRLLEELEYFNQLSERDNFTLQFTLVIFTDKRRPIEIRRNHLGRR